MTPPPANGGGGGGGDVVDLYGFPLPSLDAASLAARAACDVAAARRAPRWEGVAAGGELPPADELKAMARKVCVCGGGGEREEAGEARATRSPIRSANPPPSPSPSLL
jgi:hypothetical protein